MSPRRRLLIALGASAIASPSGAFAQRRPNVRRIGMFHVGLDHIPPALDGIKEGLKALGYDEGKNIIFDFRNLADGIAARSTASEFVRDKVDLIVAFENQPIQAAKDATAKIPVIMLNMSDPVADGFVKTLAHPGGNITGFTGLGDTQAKELELFKQLMPRLRRVLLLYAESDPASLRWLGYAREAGRVLDLQFVERQASHRLDVERIFADLRPGEVDGAFVCSPHLRIDFHSLIVAQAVKHRLPLVGQRAHWVSMGALFSYSADFRAVGKLGMARQIDKILKGARPADLPVEQISQFFELVVNRRVATGYGITIPQSILARADRVIE
jgi:putative ABC transport system substrate-binding protein